MTTETPQFLTVGEVAERLNLSHRAVLHRIAKGQIAATKIGKGQTSAYVIAPAEVERVAAKRAAA